MGEACAEAANFGIQSACQVCGKTLFIRGYGDSDVRGNLCFDCRPLPSDDPLGDAVALVDILSQERECVQCGELGSHKGRRCFGCQMDDPHALRFPDLVRPEP